MTTARRKKATPVEPPRVEVVPIAQLLQDPENANLGTERGDWMLETSLSRTGVGRGVVASKGGRLIGGNKTVAKAGEIGVQEAVLVHTKGNQIVVNVRDDLEDGSPTALEMGVWDNRVPQENIMFDEAQLLTWQEQGAVPLSLMFHDFEISSMRERMDQALASMGASDGDEQDEEGAGDEEREEGDARPKLSRADIPDAMWATENDYGIPLLDLHKQADVIDAPAVIWGSQRRTARMRGTWFFYTEDYRYTALWDDPTQVVNSGCVTAVEPNFSCYQDMPLAVALYRIYQKRWLARYWQTQGIRVLVDLNVATPFAEHNLMGVPDGWRAYATRGYNDRVGGTEAEYELACRKAGTTDILFVVYGGGKVVKQLCGKRGWVHIQEDMDRAKDGTKERTDREVNVDS